MIYLYTRVSITYMKGTSNAFSSQLRIRFTAAANVVAVSPKTSKNPQVINILILPSDVEYIL